jgi:amino acid adenylation domain-containing protein
VLHYKRLLEVAVDAPETSIGALDFLLAGEREELLEKFNSTAVAYPADKTVVDLFVEQAARTPDATALVFEEQRMSYRELDEKSNQLARYLQAQGVGRESLVPLCMERSMDMVLGLLGILKAGGAYVPIDPSYPPTRIAFVINDIQAKIFLSNTSIRHSLSDFHEITIFLDEVRTTIEKESPKAIQTNPAGKDLAYIIYTSGSTGTPKGVMIEHKSLNNLCNWHTYAFEVKQQSKATLFSSIAFDASVWEIFPYLIAGATLYPINRDEIRIDSNELASFFNSNGISHVYLPTKVCQELIKQKVEIFNTKVLTGGEALTLSSTNSIPVFNNYGPTENTVVTSSYECKEISSTNISIGKPIDNVECLILSEKNTLQPIGAIGEICVGGAGLARGYLNQPELTEEKFIAHPFREGERLYKTGDLGRWLPDGTLEFRGRKDHQVKIRGYRIELGEIESVLEQVEDVSQSVVVAREDQQGNKQLVAYVVSAQSMGKAAIQKVLAEKLPDYMIPRAYVFLEELPLTHNGKVDRKALPVPQDDAYHKQVYVAPETELEIQLAEIWQQVLGIEKVGLHDNFFDLGGHSLAFTNLNVRIKTCFNIKIGLHDFFNTPTIAKLAQAIDAGAIASGKETRRKKTITI